MKRPDDYAPSNPAAAEGIEHKRTFGGNWPMKQVTENTMIDLPKLRADVARAICNASGPPCGSECLAGEVFPAEGCLFIDEANAAIAVVLGAVAEHIEQRAGHDTAPTASNLLMKVGMGSIADDIRQELDQLATSARGEG